MNDAACTARRLSTLFEPVHVVTCHAAGELATLLTPVARACAAALPPGNPLGAAAPAAGS
jgi:hypothetical protein